MSISMKRQFSLMLTLSLVCGIAMVGFIALSVSSGLESLRDAARVTSLVLKSRTAVTIMESSLKSMILDSGNKAAEDAKKSADEENQQIIKEILGSIAGESFKKVAGELKEFDEKNLNPVEDKVLELAKQSKTQEARELYVKEYMPLFKKYEALSISFAKLAQDRADEISKSATRGTMIIALLTVTIGMALLLSLLGYSGLKMRRSLKEIIQGLNREAGFLTTSSGGILNISNGLSEGISKQAAALHETATAAEEVNAMVARTAENSHRAQLMATKSTDSVHQGREVVQRLLKAMNGVSQGNTQVRERVETGNQKLAEIVRMISEIGEKTKVINDIVFQTKLLSFNASVEAARAGEHGKGFAVVAEEVGNLARMSGEAAKEIGGLLGRSISSVQTIVAETQTEVNQVLLQGEERVKVGESVAEECQNLFHAIVTEVEAISANLDQISTAAKEQAVGVNGISDAVRELNTVSNEQADAAQSYVETSSALARHSQSLLSVVDELKILIDGDLTDVTTRFVGDLNSGPGEGLRQAA